MTANSSTVQDRYRRFKYQHKEITYLPTSVSHHIWSFSYDVISD